MVNKSWTRQDKLINNYWSTRRGSTSGEYSYNDVSLSCGAVFIRRPLAPPLFQLRQRSVERIQFYYTHFPLQNSFASFIELYEIVYAVWKFFHESASWESTDAFLFTMRTSSKKCLGITEAAEVTQSGRRWALLICNILPSIRFMCTRTPATTAVALFVRVVSSVQVFSHRLTNRSRPKHRRRM